MRRGLLLLLLVVGLLPLPASAAVRYVTKSGVDNTTCAQSSPCASIEHAVTIANPGDTISIGKGTFKETVGVSIDKALTINGAGAFSTTVSTVWNASVFTVDLGVTASISAVFVRHGQADVGGGIRNDGALTLEHVRIWQNRSGAGGGIFNGQAGVLTLRDSEIAYNDAQNGYGGGLRNIGIAI
jgi:hypothetical protein